MAKSRIDKNPKIFKAKNLVGTIFGRLRVVEFYGRIDSKNFWVCICECGKKKISWGPHLLSGDIKSCGCLSRQVSRENFLIHGESNKTKTKEYESWMAMKARCYHVNNISYKNYGGRGIRVCRRWLQGAKGKHPFLCFLHDMGRRPTNNHSLDRKNNKKGYSPENCRWATKAEQMYNTSRTIIIKIDGEALPLCIALKKYNISATAYYLRRRKGWSIPKTFKTPPRSGNFR